MIPVIRQDNPGFNDCDTPGELETIFADIYRILRSHNRAIVKIGGKPVKAEAKKNKVGVGLVLMLILFCCSVANAGILWTWDMFNPDGMEKWMYDPAFRVPIDMQNGAIIGNSPDGSIYFTEASETIEWVFSTNNVEVKSDTGVLGWDMNDIYFVFNEISAPSGNPATNQGWLYVQDSGGTTTLYFEDSAGTVTSCIGAGGVTDLDTAYNGGNTIDVDGSAVTLTVSLGDNNPGLIVVQNDSNNDPTAMQITSAADAANAIALDIDAQTTGRDIEGTGASWYVSGAGAATFASLTTTTTLGVTTDLTITGVTTANGNVVLGNAVSDTVTITGSIIADVYLDDGSGAPPQLIFKDGSDETAAFNKTLTGALSLTTQSDDGLNILVGNLRVGNGTPGTASMDGEDTYLEGDVEIDGQTTHDGVTVMNEYLDLNEELDIDLDAADETVDISTSATTYTADSAVVTVYSSGAGATNNTYLLRLRNATANDAQDHFLVLENNDADDVFAINSGGTTTWSPEAASYVRIDADTTANTTTTGVLDLNVQSATNGSIALAIDVQQETGATAAYGIDIDLDDDTAGAEFFYGLNIGNSAGTNATAVGINAENTLDDVIVATLGVTGQYLTLDASTATNTTTTGLFDIGAILSESGASVINIDVETEADGASEEVYGVFVQMDDDADNATNEIHGIHVQGDGTNGSGLQHGIVVQGANIDAGIWLETGYLRVGTGSSPGQALGGADNVFIEGTLEVDGVLYADAAGGIVLANGVTIASGTNEKLTISDSEDLVISFATGNTVTLETTTAVDTIEFGVLDELEGIQTVVGDNAQSINFALNNVIEFTENSDTLQLIFGSNKIELGSGAEGVIELDMNDIDTISDLRVIDSGTDPNIEWVTNSLTKKRVVVPICYVSATELRAGTPGFSQLCDGLEGVDELGSTEGYVLLSDGTDYVRFGIQLPDDFIDAGAVGDLIIEFDMWEKAAEEVNLEVKIYQYGDATPEVDDTIVIADAAARGWVTFVTLSTGIGAVATIDAEDVLIVEITQEGADDAEDVWIYGARLTYRTGIQNTQ